MSSSVFAQRVAVLRTAMRERGVHACVVLTSDPHLSEYLPEQWQARRWLSGFEGSAGTLLVTADFAGLWTDSRYWEQAESELAQSGIVLMRAGAPDVPTMLDWLVEHLSPNSCVSVDGRALAMQVHDQWHNRLKARQINLDCDLDLPGTIWNGRPGPPHAPIYEHLPPFACRSRGENLAAVRAAMEEHEADWHFISSLDDIAWLLNLRGGDVPYNPVFMAHALLGKEEIRLFVDATKLDAALRAVLECDGVVIRPYEEAGGALLGLPQDACLLYDPARTTVGMVGGLSVRKVPAINPSQLLKSRKNAAEIEHVRRTMEHDGAALCEFFAWFEAALGTRDITELTVDEEITRARSRRPHFVSPSFGTIAAFKANGAMPHYHATERSHARIEGDGLLLIDSGGQYLGGTTDITRVVPAGQVSALEKRDYTAVLRGMIALSMAVFPRGTSSPLLDTVARMPIWQTGADYGHGTGHGVGYFMNVHEGPQSIAYRATTTPHMAMEAGMITSNEPGLYRPGKWGIRIENLVLAVPALSTEFGDFLGFETLTLCPIDTRCLDLALLQPAERAWLNDYHAQVQRRLLPLVQGAAREWLLERTQEV